MAHEDDKTIDQLNEEADIAADYLEALLDIVDYDGDIELGVRNNRPNVQIVADDDSDIRHLVGKNGEVVDALQLLTRLAVQQKTGDRSRLLLDVDGFLKKRRKHLQDLALDAMDEVSDTGEPVDLDPMNSYERKVIHDLVREEGFKSRSHGEEPHRHVTIYLKSKARDEELDDDVDVDVETDGERFRDREEESQPEFLTRHARRSSRVNDDDQSAVDADISNDELDDDVADDIVDE